MTEVDLEHYKVARLVSPNGETFTREKFLQKYYAEFPGRAPKSILPADYADGNNPSVKRKPKFLERVGHDRSGEYRRTRQESVLRKSRGCSFRCSATQCGTMVKRKAGG
jgi:hypothetical protein